MEMKVQEFLRNGGTLDQLTEKYAIKVKRHGKYPELVLLKYNQIDSPFQEEIVQECRGLILNESDNWNVISISYKKFFNVEEQLAAKIDWSTARVQEKVDGSLCVLYWYKDEWHVQTSGTPDASGEVNGFDISFRDLFWSTYEANAGFEPPNSLKDLCFIFELTSPYNRVVVAHKEPKLTLLGIRNRVTGSFLNDEGLSPGLTTPANIPVVKSFPLTNLDQILASFKSFSGFDQEGYVVVDANQNRVKIKHPGYVAAHHLKGNGFNPRRIMEVIKANEQGEVLAHFPEFKEDFDRLQDKYEALIKSLEDVWGSWEAYPGSSRKEFAMVVKDLPGSGVLFAIYSGKIKDIREGVSQMKTDTLVEMFGEKLEEAAIQE